MSTLLQEQPLRAKSQPPRVVDGVSERIHSGALKPGETPCGGLFLFGKAIKHAGQRAPIDIVAEAARDAHD